MVITQFPKAVKTGERGFRGFCYAPPRASATGLDGTVKIMGMAWRGPL
jgi:hypothetical protein